MPFERLKAIVLADIRDRGVSPTQLDAYVKAWADAARPGAHAPMPCPACFARGTLSALKGRTVADGYAAAVCSRCHITFQFSKGPKRDVPATTPSQTPSLARVEQSDES